MRACSVILRDAAMPGSCEWAIIGPNEPSLMRKEGVTAPISRGGNSSDDVASGVGSGNTGAWMGGIEVAAGVAAVPLVKPGEGVGVGVGERSAAGMDSSPKSARIAGLPAYTGVSDTMIRGTLRIADHHAGQIRDDGQFGISR